jgi:hypothetical protein
MKTMFLHLAAAELELSPLSIEPDGTMWTGMDNDRTYLTAAQIQEITERATEMQSAKATARQALLEKLGITEEEAQLLLGGI